MTSDAFGNAIGNSIVADMRYREAERKRKPIIPTNTSSAREFTRGGDGVYRDQYGREAPTLYADASNYTGRTTDVPASYPDDGSIVMSMDKRSLVLGPPTVGEGGSGEGGSSDHFNLGLGTDDGTSLSPFGGFRTSDGLGYGERIANAWRGSVTYSRTAGDFISDLYDAVVYGDPYRKSDGLEGFYLTAKGGYSGMYDSAKANLSAFFSHPITSVADTVSGTASFLWDNSFGSYFETSQQRNDARIAGAQHYVDTYTDYVNADMPEEAAYHLGPVGWSIMGMAAGLRGGVTGATTPSYLTPAEFAELPGKGTINPRVLRFSQDNAGANFKPPYGSVDDLAAKLRSGDVNPSTIDPVRIVERDGKIFTLDNRRLYSFQEADVPIPYQKLDAIPEHELFKFTTTNDGTSIVIRRRK